MGIRLIYLSPHRLVHGNYAQPERYFLKLTIVIISYLFSWNTVIAPSKIGHRSNQQLMVECPLFKIKNRQDEDQLLLKVPQGHIGLTDLTH